MPIRNQNWYNLQSTRRYPLDDKTTGEDDSGGTIRDDIIVDCHIRYPETLGKYLFIQGLTVTPNLVSVVIGAADDLDQTNCPTVAAITVTKPLARNVNELITSFVPGLSGWVAFGPGVETNFVGRYSTPKQTFIGLRNARAYRPLPIPTIGKNTVAQSLTGVISLIAETPVVATYYPAYTVPKYDPETGETNALPVKAIVFSTDAPTAQYNPLTAFLGPCTERPESGNCPKTPIERINGVEPDCETGNINIVVGDGLSAATFEECGGMDITTELGLSMVCEKTPPSERPRRDDCPCEDDDGVSEYCWPQPPEDPDDSNDLTNCTNNAPCSDLPVIATFGECVPCDEAGSGSSAAQSDFETVSGSFNFTDATVPPSECGQSNNFAEGRAWRSNPNSGLNISLFKYCAGDWAYGKTVSARLRPTSGGTRRNGGVVLNYTRAIENGRCRSKYFAVMVDIIAGELQLYRFDGNLLIKENAVPIPYAANSWYALSASAAGTNGSATITATLFNITNGTFVTSLATNVTDYEIINGLAGIISNSSATEFSSFKIE